MKKSEKYIYIVLVVILVGVLASGITYIIMDKQNNKDEVKEPSNNKNKPEENEDKEAITLTEKEIDMYLAISLMAL